MKNPLCPILAVFALALLPLAAPAQEAYPTRVEIKGSVPFCSSSFASPHKATGVLPSYGAVSPAPTFDSGAVRQ